MFKAFYSRLQGIITEVDGLGYGILGNLSTALEDNLEWQPDGNETL